LKAAAIVSAGWAGLAAKKYYELLCEEDKKYTLFLFCL